MQLRVVPGVCPVFTLCLYFTLSDSEHEHKSTNNKTHRQGDCQGAVVEMGTVMETGARCGDGDGSQAW